VRLSVLDETTASLEQQLQEAAIAATSISSMQPSNTAVTEETASLGAAANTAQDTESVTSSHTDAAAAVDDRRAVLKSRSSCSPLSRKGFQANGRCLDLGGVGLLLLETAWGWLTETGLPRLTTDKTIEIHDDVSAVDAKL
jgi:hypothetical protein